MHTCAFVIVMRTGVGESARGETRGAELRADLELTPDLCTIDILLYIAKVCGCLLCSIAVPKVADTLTSSPSLTTLHSPWLSFSPSHKPSSFLVALPGMHPPHCCADFTSHPLSLSLNVTSLERTYLAVLSELRCNVTFYMFSITVPCSFPS